LGLEHPSPGPRQPQMQVASAPRIHRKGRFGGLWRSRPAELAEYLEEDVPGRGEF